MSDETTNTPQTEHTEDSLDHPPALRREAVYVVTDPRKFAGVAAVTALAGVAIGFALALLAQPQQQCECGGRYVQVVERPHVRMTPIPPMHSQANWKLTWLGVEVQSRGQGAVVVDVFEGTPAEQAGLKVGDVIESLEDTPIRESGDLIREVRLRDAGDPVELEVSRDGQEREIEATLTEIRPQDIPR